MWCCGADTFLRYMWTSDSSVLQFIREAPSSIHYLFISYGRKFTSHQSLPNASLPLSAAGLLCSAWICSYSSSTMLWNAKQFYGRLLLSTLQWMRSRMSQPCGIACCGQWTSWRSSMQSARSGWPTCTLPNCRCLGFQTLEQILFPTWSVAPDVHACTDFSVVACSISFPLTATRKWAEEDDGRYKTALCSLAD